MAKNNTKQKEKLYQDLEDCCEKLSNALEIFRKDIDAIQEGNGHIAYWNGNNAYSILKTSLVQYDMNKTLLDYINECKESTKH